MERTQQCVHAMKAARTEVHATQAASLAWCSASADTWGVDLDDAQISVEGSTYTLEIC